MKSNRLTRITKITTIILLLICILFVAGCGSKKDPQPQEEVEISETNIEEEKEKEAEPEAESSDSAVASKEEMVEAEDVVEDWMVPIGADSLKDGTYPITVSSSSSMFKIDSAELTVANGEMTAVMTMGGKGYRYLFMGTGEEASEADEASFINYVENADGAHTYEVPVANLDEGIDCTAFSNKKEKWYDRTLVFRSDSLPLEAFKDELVKTVSTLGLQDGEYTCQVSLNGGTGRASIETPTKIVVNGDSCIATITWSSSNYDYMIVDGEKYLPITMEEHSVFEIPVKAFDRPLGVIGDTIAMSEPHEVEYALIFDSSSIE